MVYWGFLFYPARHNVTFCNGFGFTRPGGAMNTTTPASSTTPRFISVQDAAADLCVSDQLLWKLIRNGKFPAKYVKIGALIRIDRKSWESFLESGTELAPAVKRGRKPKATPALDMNNLRSLSMYKPPGGNPAAMEKRPAIFDEAKQR